MCREIRVDDFNGTRLRVDYVRRRMLSRSFYPRLYEAQETGVQTINNNDDIFNNNGYVKYKFILDPRSIESSSLTRSNHLEMVILSVLFSRVYT